MIFSRDEDGYDMSSIKLNYETQVFFLSRIRVRAAYLYIKSGGRRPKYNKKHQSTLDQKWEVLNREGLLFYMKTV